MQKVIDIKAGIARMPEWRMKTPVDFQLLTNEHLAIVGPNGGGKTMFVDMLTGRHPLLGDNPRYCFAKGGSNRLSDNIKYIAFVIPMVVIMIAHIFCNSDGIKPRLLPRQ